MKIGKCTRFVAYLSPQTKDSRVLTAIRGRAVRCEKSGGKVAGVDQVSDDGKARPLVTIAASQKCESILKMLLENGADANQRTIFIVSPRILIALNSWYWGVCRVRVPQCQGFVCKTQNTSFFGCLSRVLTAIWDHSSSRRR